MTMPEISLTKSRICATASPRRSTLSGKTEKILLKKESRWLTKEQTLQTIKWEEQAEVMLLMVLPVRRVDLQIRNNGLKRKKQQYFKWNTAVSLYSKIIIIQNIKKIP